MRKKLIARNHRQTEPNHPAVRMNELCEAIDAPFQTEAQFKFIPSAAHGLIWREPGDHSRIGMRNANGRTKLARRLRRGLNAKPRWRWKGRLMHHGAKPCGLIDLSAHWLATELNGRIPFDSASACR